MSIIVGCRKTFLPSHEMNICQDFSQQILLRTFRLIPFHVSLRTQHWSFSLDQKAAGSFHIRQINKYIKQSVWVHAELQSMLPLRWGKQIHTCFSNIQRLAMKALDVFAQRPVSIGGSELQKYSNLKILLTLQSVFSHLSVCEHEESVPCSLNLTVNDQKINTAS